MKRTVWDRVDGVATMSSQHWEGDDAPTNVALPSFARASNSGFWKGVVVGVGACVVLSGFAAAGGAAVFAVATYGFPALPAGSAAIAQVEEEIATPVVAREDVRRPVVVEPPAPVVAEVVRPVVVEAPAPVVAEVVEPVATPVAIRKVVEPARPAPKAVAARTKPVETRRAPAPVATPAPVAKVVATPAPAPVARPEPPRPNRDELLQLALAAKKTPAAPAPTPVPAAKWDVTEAKSDDVAAADDKWMPIDDIEAETSSPAKDSSSDDLSKVLED